MHIIENNPYRAVALLVGASARELERQVNWLTQYIRAEQEPPKELIENEFPSLGQLNRTEVMISEAKSKLTFDSDKMNAALFWFYKGNPKTDKQAFEALKDGDLAQVINIWTEQTSNGEVTQHNASAYSNLGTLYLSGVLGKTNKTLLEQGISLKLKFLESDLVKDFKALATDEAFKTTKKELQLLFLNQVQSEIEKKGGITSKKFLEIITRQEFSAKADFLEEFVQKPIEQIENKIEETRKSQKANPAKAGEYGDELYKSTKILLSSIIDILGKSDIRISSISDKLANEILQCSIAVFNHFHETDTEVGEIALDLNKKAGSIALGGVVKGRINDSTPIVERYIDNRPEREKIKLIKPELEFITLKLERFQDLPDTIANARELIDSCKSKLIKIKQSLGSTDEFYLNLSSSVVQNAQSMLVQAVNEKIENDTSRGNGFPTLFLLYLDGTIDSALDTTYKLGTLDMHLGLRTHYLQNLESIKSIARELNISTLPPKEKLRNELRQAEDKLKEIQNTTFFKSELSVAETRMREIKKWQFLRSQLERRRQINSQQPIINDHIKRSDAEKVLQSNKQQAVINEIKFKIQKAEY